VYHSNF